MVRSMLGDLKCHAHVRRIRQLTASLTKRMYHSRIEEKQKLLYEYSQRKTVEKDLSEGKQRFYTQAPCFAATPNSGIIVGISGSILGPGQDSNS